MIKINVCELYLCEFYPQRGKSHINENKINTGKTNHMRSYFLQRLQELITQEVILFS